MFLIGIFRSAIIPSLPSYKLVFTTELVELMNILVWYAKVLEIVREHMPPANEVCDVYGMYPFMVAASYKESPLSVVYVLLRQDPFVIDCKISKMKTFGNGLASRVNSTVGNTNKHKRFTTF